MVCVACVCSTHTHMGHLPHLVESVLLRCLLRSTNVRSEHKPASQAYLKANLNLSPDPWAARS